MRVKRLEIQGFKSFKDKTIIHFDHSITGIVGPNGCGKSNIVDAFFWVMGEQSYKHMRGNKSEDLIFNGSSKYSPLGIAEATLVLETFETEDSKSKPKFEKDLAEDPLKKIEEGLAHSQRATDQHQNLQEKEVETPKKQGKEISVTRRLHRSGEGEYFINGTQARLKDIHELFMDTGVGTKGYSVIEQGQIGKIVNAKPEERRLLIEEAAGIAKYKARKKESLRKMDATHSNLARLNDIIQELEKNLRSLDRQAQKAKLFRKYRDELFEKEITWGKRKKTRFETQLEEFKSTKTTLEEDVVRLRSEIQTGENLIETDQTALVTESKESEEKQLLAQELSESLSQEKSALELSRRRQSDLTSQIEALTQENLNLSENIASDQQKLADHENEVSQAGDQAKEISEKTKNSLEALTQVRDRLSKVRKELAEDQTELHRYSNDITHLQSEHASLEAKHHSQVGQKESLKEQFQVESQRKESLQIEVYRLQSELTRHEEKSEALAEKLKELRETESEKKGSVRSLREETHHLRELLSETASMLKSLEELQASYEGLSDGSRAILDWSREQGLSDKAKPLSDLLQIEDGKEALIQAWLESKMDTLVTSDVQFAIDRLISCQNEKHGRALFQLATANNGNLSSDFNLDEVHQFLKDLNITPLEPLQSFIRFDQSTETLKFLFDRVIRIESLSEAQIESLYSASSPLVTHGVSLITDEGLVLEAGGVIRGGNLDSSGSLSILKRKNQIESLQEEKIRKEEALKQSLDSLEKAEQELADLENQLETVRIDSRNSDIQKASVSRDLHQTEKSLEQISGQLNKSEGFLEKLQTQIEEAESRKLEVQEQLEEIRSRRSEIESRISQESESVASLEVEVETKDRQYNEIKLQEVSLNERSRSLTREMEAIRRHLDERSYRLEEVKTNLEKATQELTGFSGGDSDLNVRIEELTLKLSTTKESLSLIKNQMEERNTKINSVLSKNKQLHSEVEKKSKKASELALEAEKIAGELSHLVLTLEEKYGDDCFDRPTPPIQTEMDAPVVPEEVIEEEDDQLEEKVEILKDRIRKLGEVNMVAIEEFEQIQKRHEHLLAERADLEHSLKNLQDAIEHINKTSEQRFKTAFETIADRFERLFPIIFGGGSARLSLTYPEGCQDILDAGVDIMAQPPGKKVVNITLLSGGEKALTAVSLIFAIFMVKPSPFCVLDEVDAPLDDANIGKFNALLREMSQKSQFILITHNKKTMELNDTLYGVTMEEPGVSKMVSIEMA